MSEFMGKLINIFVIVEMNFFEINIDDVWELSKYIKIYIIHFRFIY